MKSKYVTVQDKYGASHSVQVERDFDYRVKEWNANRKNTSLLHCYANPSDAKWSAYERCLNYCADFNLHNFCITGYNTFMFSASAIFTHTRTGEILAVVHFTPNYTRWSFSEKVKVNEFGTLYIDEDLIGG